MLCKQRQCTHGWGGLSFAEDIIHTHAVIFAQPSGFNGGDRVLPIKAKHGLCID